MLHALPWCLVVGLLLILRLDPNPSSLSSRLNLDFDLGILRLPRSFISIDEFGTGIHIFQVIVITRIYSFSCVGAIFNIILDTVQFLFVLVGCIKFNNFEYAVLFPRQLVYSDISRETCFGRNIYALLQFTVKLLSYIVYEQMFVTNWFIFFNQHIRLRNSAPYFHLKYLIYV